MERMIRYRVKATGRVQGVGFRVFAYLEAQKLGVTGYAHNQYDGSVDLELQGSPEAVAELLSRIRKGNGYMDVEDLSIREIPVKPGDSGFDLNY